MDELHRRLITVGLAALASDYGFALAGGYAVQVHDFVQRVSDDVDLFTPIERSGELPAATRCLADAYAQEGYQVELGHSSPTYVRLQVTDTSTGRTSKVELVAEHLSHAPVPSELGPVLHRDDVAAGKMEALFTRAEVRDFIDVDALLRAGYTRQRLVQLAAGRDTGFDLGVLADMFGSAGRFNDRQFAVYGIGAEAIAGIRAEFAEWQAELRSTANEPRATGQEAVTSRADAARATSSAIVEAHGVGRTDGPPSPLDEAVHGEPEERSPRRTP